jgi:hypothetical protein
VLEEFIAEFRRCIADPARCWNWLGERNEGGYGTFCSRPIYRLVYLIWRGGVVGWHIRHLCHNPPCCNPAHLARGTPTDNSRDMARAGHGSKKHRALTSKQALCALWYHFNNNIPEQLIAAELKVANSVIFELICGRRYQHERDLHSIIFDFIHRRRHQHEHDLHHGARHDAIRRMSLA